MKTYFVCSDIHGFFSPWMACLKESGFEFENPDHILIILGDIFDRGKENKKVYSFLRDFPEDRRILITGNHELLLLDLLKAGYPLSHDYSNGTFGTLVDFAYGINALFEERKRIQEDDSLIYEEKSKKLFALDILARRRLFDGKAIRKVESWIKSDQWRFYFETPHYVFVHSWVPLMYDEDGNFAYNPHWRKASQREWEEAAWGCPYQHYLNGLWRQELLNGKTLVCGHWHTSDFYNHLDYANQPEKQMDIRVSNPIYQSSKYPGLIGLDACTALTKTVNVLVLQESEL